MEEQKSLARKLPEFTIAGTVFTVDARLNEFRQRDAPWNRISMDEIADDGDLSGFLYDKNTQQVYTGEADPNSLPDHVCLVIIPPIIELDPVRLARRFGLADHDLIPDSNEKQQTVEGEALKKPQNISKNHKKGRRI